MPLLQLLARAGAIVAQAFPIAVLWRSQGQVDFAERGLAVCERALVVLDRRERALEQVSAEACADALRSVRDAGSESGAACCRAEEACRRGLAAADAAAVDARAARAAAESRLAWAVAAAVSGWGAAVALLLILTGSAAGGVALPAKAPVTPPSPLLADRAHVVRRGGVARPSDFALRYGGSES